MEELLLKFIPLAIPVVVLLIKKLVPLIPKKYIPTTIGLLGLAYGAVTGQPDGEIIAFLANMLEGGTVALAGVGVHQVGKQVKKAQA